MSTWHVSSNFQPHLTVLSHIRRFETPDMDRCGGCPQETPRTSTDTAMDCELGLTHGHEIPAGPGTQKKNNKNSNDHNNKNKNENKKKKKKKKNKKKKKKRRKKNKKKNMKVPTKSGNYLAPEWLPCQAPGIIGSALGLVGPVSVNCDWMR